MSQESDTFNPAPTTFDHFESYGVHRGADVLANAHGQITGHLAAAGSAVESVGIFSAMAVAGGRLSAATLERLADEVRAGLLDAGHLDGLALFLHGACAAEGVDDVEGHLLGVVRRVVGPDLPIALGLDHHANLTAAMVDGADVVVGHRTQPHDLVDTGRLTTALLLRLLAGEVRPTMAWRKLPMLTHQEQYLTSGGPMGEWFGRARAMEDLPGVLQVSPFPMQPWLDVDDAGWSVLVVTDGDAALAGTLADQLADHAWDRRHAFLERTSLPVAEAVAGLEAAERGVVVMSDTGDSVRGGAGGDSTVIIAELIRQGAAGPVLVPLVQPDLAELTAGAAVGDHVSLRVGGAVAGMHEPVTVTGRLVHLAPTEVVFGADYVNPSADLGMTAVMATSFGHLVITEHTGIGGVHPEMYRQLGLDPAAHKGAVIKTASNFQHFASIASALVRVDTPGPTQSDILGLPWRRAPRPIFPLDEIADWRPSPDR